MKKGIFLFLLFLLNIVIWLQILSLENKDGLKVVFLDVGQGDAIFIETKSGNQVLIDAGGGDKILRELSKQMSFFDHSIDMVIATHPDSDHIGGISDVLSKYDVDLFLESGSKSETLVYKSLEEALSNENLKRMTAHAGEVFDLGDGIYLKVLFPDRDVSLLDPNMASIITQLSYGEISFMLTGDSPMAIEKYLSNKYGLSLESEILKAGHHGSKTSSSDIFLSLISPEYVVISAGLNNRYGHPHPEVIERLKDSNIKILETSKEGSIVFVSDGEEVRVK